MANKTTRTDYRQKPSALLPVNNLELMSSPANASETARRAAETARLVAQARQSAGAGSAPAVGRVSGVNADAQKQALRQAYAAAVAQANAKTDYATGQGVNELLRAQQDAAPGFDEQRRRTDIDEARALDNHSLYAEARGDRGGIGQAQYGSVQNAAANSRYAINAAQQKLAADTQRQIADLRAKGEYEKADNVLSVSREYAQKLADLEKWAAEKNISIDEFNAGLEKWEKEYALDLSKYLTDAELSAVKLTGVFSDGTETAAYAEQQRKQAAAAGEALMKAGITPTKEQLAAMGWTEEEYWIWRMSNPLAYGA